LKRDPQEYDAEKKELIKAARAEAEFSMKQDGTINLEGSCHILWERQQKILIEKYGVVWRSPAEMNPDIIFD